MLTDPALIIFANVLQGFGFSSFNYCLLNYINNRMPAELRASSQVLNTTLSMIFSKLIFGYVGGLAFDLLGASSMMLCSAVTMGTATAVFWCWNTCSVPWWRAGPAEKPPGGKRPRRCCPGGWCRV